MNSDLMMPYVGFYDDVPTFDAQGNIVSGRINPLDALDVSDYSSNIASNALNILSNTLAGNAKGGYSMEIDDSKLSATQRAAVAISPTINFTSDFAYFIRNYANTTASDIRSVDSSNDGYLVIESQPTSVPLA